MHQRLVIIASSQFGYHTDTYYYCKYLRSKYNVIYIGWDHGLEPMILDGVKVISVSRHGGPLRVLRFLTVIWNETRENNSIIFIKYFKFLSVIIRVMRLKNSAILDIRTGSVAQGNLRRRMEDALLKVETKFFQNITVISTGLAKKLALDKKAIILPLGADVISVKSKRFDGLHLLYVGTLHNRNITNIVRGVAQYYSKHVGNEIDVTLTIIGDGFSGELNSLQNEIEKAGLKKIINLTGWIPHDQLSPYFDTHNIGVSYIPMTEYYDAQPPTKTFEYLMSGMPVLATNTSENALIINKKNGVLIGDLSEDVCNGLDEIEKKLNSYSSIEIREQSKKYAWKKVVHDLGDYLERL